MNEGDTSEEERGYSAEDFVMEVLVGAADHLGTSPLSIMVLALRAVALEIASFDEEALTTFLAELSAFHGGGLTPAEIHQRAGVLLNRVARASQAVPTGPSEQIFIH